MSNGPRKIPTKIQFVRQGDLLDLSSGDFLRAPGAGEPIVRRNLENWQDLSEALQCLRRFESMYTEVLDIAQDTEGSFKIRFRSGAYGELRFPLDYEVMVVCDD